MTVWQPITNNIIVKKNKRVQHDARGIRVREREREREREKKKKKKGRGGDDKNLRILVSPDQLDIPLYLDTYIHAHTVFILINYSDVFT